MAVAEILSTIKGFVTASSKSQTEFKSESSKNNRNISDALRDISRMFSSQKAINQKNDSALSELIDVTQSTSRTTQQNNDLLKESISLQNNMLDELRKINTGVGSLIKSFDASGLNQENQSSLGSNAIRAAGAALGLGAVALPGMLNNFYGKEFNANLSAEQAGQNANFSGSTSGGMPPAEISKLAKQAGFNDQEAKIMTAIALAESGGNPTTDTARSGLDPGMQKEYSLGLWQINWKAHKDGILRNIGVSTPDQLRDPETNARAAKAVYDAQGYKAWSVYKNNRYSQFLEGDDSGVYGKPNEGPDYGGLKPNSSAMGGGGNVLEQQSSEAAIRKQPISEKLKEVLKQAAAMAGVDVVIHSGGQPSKESGRGPRTGSTRHDDGNAADLYLQKDGKILKDYIPEDRETMARFVSAATQAGATGIGLGAQIGKNEDGSPKYSYMGPSSIHVGFGRPATWGGSPWIAQAASGIYNNPDLSSSGGMIDELGNMAARAAGSAMESINSAFKLFGMENVDAAGFLSSFFGVPILGSDDLKEEQNSMSQDEKEEEGSLFNPTASDNLNPFVKTKQAKPESDDKGFMNYERFGNLADQIKEASMIATNPIIVTGPVNTQTSSNSPEAEFMTDFGAAGNQPRNTRASWAPRVAVLRPDEKVTESIRWAARISPNLMT